MSDSPPDRSSSPADASTGRSGSPSSVVSVISQGSPDAPDSSSGDLVSASASASLDSIDASMGPLLLEISPYGWYHITIYSDDISCDVMEVVETTVAPLKLKLYDLNRGFVKDKDQSCISFYVDSCSLAYALARHSKPLRGVNIVVTAGGPLIEVDAAYKSKLRRLLLSRYDERSSCLNLSSIYADYATLGDFCVLEHPECLEAVLEFAEQELPQLQCLHLDSNHLKQLDGFWGVEQRLPCLRLVSLIDNNLKTMDSISALRHLPITKLWLNENPLPNNYERQATILFPKLVTLDGRPVRRSSSMPTDLGPAPLPLEAGDISSPSPPPPPSSPRVMPLDLSPSVQQKVRTFVLRYLRAFDEENRAEHLADFYKEMVVVTLTLPTDRGKPCSWADRYVEFSQNLVGRRAALEMFASWPRTFHLASTLNFDIIVAQRDMVYVTLTGTFAEHQRNGTLKNYLRYFVLVGNDGQPEHDRDELLIGNELIYLSPTDYSVRSLPFDQLNPEEKSLRAKLSAQNRLNLGLGQGQIPDVAEPEPEPGAEPH